MAVMIRLSKIGDRNILAEARKKSKFRLNLPKPTKAAILTGENPTATAEIPQYKKTIR